MAIAAVLERALTDARIRAGQTEVVRARVRLGEGAFGGRTLFVRLMLTNPPPDAATWPHDDLLAIKHRVRDTFLRVEPELETPWAISFAPKDPDELHPDDLEDAIEVEF